jgi:hypothetical protein
VSEEEQVITREELVAYVRRHLIGFRVCDDRYRVAVFEAMLRELGEKEEP